MWQTVRAHLVGVVLLLLVLSGCDTLLHQETAGSLQLSITGTQDEARSIGPDTSVDVDHYVISGISDAGETFQQTSTEAQVMVYGLSAGYWDVTVDAYNVDDVHLYTGQQRVLVEGGQAVPVAMDLVPVPGDGTLTIGMSWPTGSVQSPVVEASLVPSQGSSVPLSFTVSGDSASFSSDQIASGYYTLVLKLKENDVLVAGAVELVQIVGGRTTQADFSFTDVNAPGSLQIGVEVAPEFSESLTVSITGGAVTSPYGTSVTLDGSVSGTTSNTVFTWYVNGEAVDTDVAQTIISGDTPGYYRVDLIVVTADGTEGGMATTWVEIAQPGV
jgi:hypothetical protein